MNRKFWRFQSYWKWYGIAMTAVVVATLVINAAYANNNSSNDHRDLIIAPAGVGADHIHHHHHHHLHNHHSSSGKFKNYRKKKNDYYYNNDKVTNNNNINSNNNFSDIIKNNRRCRDRKRNNRNSYNSHLYFNLSMQENNFLGSQLERVPPVPNTTEFQFEDNITDMHHHNKVVEKRSNHCSSLQHHHVRKRKQHNRRKNGQESRKMANRMKSGGNPNKTDNNFYRPQERHKSRGKRHDQNIDSQRIEVIKQQILSKLGLSNIPNVTSSHRSTKFLLEALSLDPRPLLVQDEDPATGTTSSDGGGIYTESSEPDDFYGRTSEIIGFAEPGYTLNGQKLLEFSWSQDMAAADLNVKSAMLWVRIEFRPDVPYSLRRLPPSLNFTFWVFQVIPSGLPNTTYLSGKEFEEHSRLSASLPVTLSSLGWKTFDVTNTVKQWYASAHKDKLRLLIDCSGCSDLVTPVLFQDTRQASEWEKPFLLIQTDPTVTRRVRRRAIDCSLAKRDQCCKQQFYIRFRDIGWHTWIIAPSGYYANYCRGDCGGFHRTPDTYINPHSFAMEDYKKINHYSLFEPCCAPLKFSSMSLIYITPDNNIIKRDLPKMVVDECGCP